MGMKLLVGVKGFGCRGFKKIDEFRFSLDVTTGHRWFTWL